MQVRVTKLMRRAAVVAGALLLAGAVALPASADTPHKKVHVSKAHFHRVHHHYARYERPLTVRGHHHYARVMAPDPYHGPAAIVTGPNAVAATIVSLPFRLVNTVFPASGNTPLILIGAPTHAAGEIAELPFWAVGSIFGAPPNVVE